MRERNGFIFDNPAGVIAALEDMLSRSEEIVGRPYFKTPADGGSLRADISKVHDYLDDLVGRLQAGRPIAGMAANSTALWDGVQHNIQDALATEFMSNALGPLGKKSTEDEVDEASYREVRRAYVSVGRRVERLPSLQTLYVEFWPVEFDVASYLSNWRGGSDTIARLDQQSPDDLRYEGPRQAIKQLTWYCSTVHRVLGPAIADTMRRAFVSEHSNLKS